MEYECNGLKRAISDTIRLTGIIMFGAWNEKYKQPKFVKNGIQKDLYQKLLDMVDRGELNEAENELIDHMDMQLLLVTADDVKMDENAMIDELEMALGVYGYMNDKSDDFLEKHAYSRVEIEYGVRNVIEKYGRICLT